MKRLITFVICLSLLQVVKADHLLNSDSSLLSNPHSGINRDTILVPVINPVMPTAYENRTFRQRLIAIQKDVPLDYNEYVQGYIDIYTTPGQRDGLGRVLGLSKYYFPIYEKAFRDAGIPEEIKYLSIVESQLNPYAVSRVGATGPWQFMFTTAKNYGLNIDNYVDERMDPIQSSYAAAAYLKDAYEEFGDWLLAIASYNCGKSNVIHAIEKAGANDFWSIRQYLPVETRGYVPAYIAMTYVMSYSNKYNITPQSCNFSTNTDTVLVNKYVSLNSVSQVLGIDKGQLTILNPAYKMQVINGTNRSPRRLVIPQAAKNKYAALYNALNSYDAPTVSVQASRDPYTEHSAAAKELPAYHRVKKGESLADIADMYGAEENDLRVWNNVHGRVTPGQRLRLSAPGAGDAPLKNKPEGSYIMYRVRQGDTLSAIASKFDGVTVEKIKEVNGLKKAHLQPGTTLKITKS